MAIVSASLLFDIGILSLCILTALYFYFKHSYTYWKKRNVPYIEPTFPVGNLGQNLRFQISIGHLFKEMYDQTEGHKYVGTYSFHKPGFLFRDPEIIKNVLVKDFSNFHDRGFHLNEKINPLSGHLFLLPGTKWRNLRVKLTPTFTSGKMKMMFQTLVECGNELGECLVESANKEEVLEIKDVLARYSTDIISSCAFGIQCNCLKNPDAEFRQWGRKIFKPSYRGVLVGRLSNIAPFLVDLLKLSNTDPTISKYFMDMVKNTVEYRENNGIMRNDFLQLLIQIKNKKEEIMGKSSTTNGYADESNKLSDNEPSLTMESLAAQVFVFFLAGFETSSTTMTFCLYELALNPDIQEKVREEIDTVLQRTDGQITYDIINEMHYLDKVVSETLRKYPPVPILNRECTKEYKVPDSDIVLEKGMKTVIPVLAIHHDPKYYPNPDKFDPERFNEEEKSKRHQYVYLPFGEGPRICIGMRFGLMQTKVGLVSLLSKYQFDVSEKTPIPLEMMKKSFILSPEGGMWLKIRRRSN